MASSKLDGIGHALSKIELHTTPKSCMQQSFKGDQMSNNENKYEYVKF